MHQLMNLWHQLWIYADRMGPRGWVAVLAAMIIVALLCMRGFGSRSQY
jgi:hypothetical protein